MRLHNKLVTSIICKNMHPVAFTRHKNIHVQGAKSKKKNRPAPFSGYLTVGWFDKFCDKRFRFGAMSFLAEFC